MRSIASAAIAVAAFLALSGAAHAQSDDCAGATAVLTGTNAGGNNCGTVNPDEAVASCQDTSGHDVWYVWTADCTGEATIDTEGSLFAPVNDTVLTVYDSICGGTEIACSDDEGTGLLSTVTFACASGTNYVIRVAGYDTGSNIRCGDITLNIACVAGGNGACCLLDGTCTDVTGGTPECDGLGGVYKGDGSSCATTNCSGACCLGNDTCQDASEASCTNAGGLYLGDGTACGVDACPPPGDVCASAVPVGSGTTIISNAGSALDDPDPSCTAQGALDVWAVYTAEQNGSLLIDTCGTWFDSNNPANIDTILAAYDGSCGGPELDCDDDCTTSGSDPSQAPCIDEPQASGNTRDSCICIDNVTIGQLIYIQVQDYNGDNTGDITLTITPNGCPPPTGSCCLSDGTCTIEGEVVCGNLGGAYGGDGSDCSVTCFGACCLPANGGCVSETEVSCTNAGGTFAGAGTICFSYDIGTGTSNGGYICEGSCADLTTLRSSPAQAAAIDITFNNDLATADVAEGTCTGSGGGNVQNDALFRYLAISDTFGPCDVTITVTPTGYDAVLVVRDNCPGAELACSDNAGVGGVESVTIPNYGPGSFVYIQVGDAGTTEGGGETQLEVTCSTASGACCLGGDCQSLTAGNCLLAGGIYKGDGTDCLTSCFGACCFGDGTCGAQTEMFCTSAGGSYQGDGVDCTPNPCPQPPENDTCATATVVDCNTGTIAGVTLDLANPDHTLVSSGSCTGFTADGPDVVYSFTPTSDLLVSTGMANVSGFDAAIYVVTDCLDTNGSCVAGDDSGGIEEVSFTALAGTTYYIITDSYTADPSPGTSFDFFINCQAVCGTCPGDLNGDSLLDGRDIQSFTNCYLSEFGTAPSNACKCADINDDNVLDDLDITAFVDVILNGGGICNAGACCYLDGGSAACTITDETGCTNLGGTFTLGGDCSGDPCPAGRCCTNDGATCNDIPEVECAAIAGDFAAGLDCTNDPCPTPLSNDDCIDATIITTLPYSDLGVDLPAATDDFNVFPDCLGSSCDAGMNVNNGVWYTYTPSGDCHATITATGLDGATSVWTGPDCGNLTQLVCSDPSTLEVDLTGGTQYWILVCKWSCASEPTGPMDFTMECDVPPPAPVNDDCDGALTIFDGATPIDLTGATDSNLPACGDFSLAPDAVRSDLFYTYVATCTGTLFVDTCGNSFDARLAIYDVDCAAIAGGALPIECNDDHGNSNEMDTGNDCPDALSASFSVPVTSGVTYIVRVGSYGAPPSTGMFNLNIACTP
ncbi:MAG: hypothetical protein H6818_21640 [Phycisphaerales bacterium]|nr:hypothetical protein [Phycisphaerales bacterium]